MKPSSRAKHQTPEYRAAQSAKMKAYWAGKRRKTLVKETGKSLNKRRLPGNKAHAIIRELHDHSR